MTNKKFISKKELSAGITISPELLEKINAEFNEYCQQKRAEIEQNLGQPLSGMYYRWFDADMAFAYQAIKNKYLREINSEKLQENTENNEKNTEKISKKQQNNNKNSENKQNIPNAPEQ